MQLHLYTDLGGDTDDACALAMILGWPGVDLLGVTTNLDIGGRRAGCAAYVLRLAARDEVPVAAGAAASLTTLEQHPSDVVGPPVLARRHRRAAVVTRCCAGPARRHHCQGRDGGRDRGVHQSRAAGRHPPGDPRRRARRGDGRLDRPARTWTATVGTRAGLNAQCDTRAA